MKLRNRKLAIVGLLSAVMWGCSGNSHKPTGTPAIDLQATLKYDNADKIEFSEVSYLPLDTVASALLRDRASVVAVMGDKLIIDDDSKRLVVFSMADGKFLGEINHIGNGPGEYDWITGVFPDYEKEEIVLSHYLGASRYTIDDKLVATYKRKNIMSRQLPVGALSGVINEGVVTGDDFMIHQFDSTFNEVDSILVPGYKPWYISVLYSQSADKGYVAIADTIFALEKGHLDPVVAFARGDKTITPEVEMETYMNNALSPEQRMEAVKSYMRYINFKIDGGLAHIIWGHGDFEYFDIYDICSGELLYRNKSNSDGDDDEWGFIVPYEGHRFNIWNMFVKDGRYYAVIPEDYVISDPDDPDREANSALISFVPVRKD